MSDRDSLQPIEGANRAARRRVTLIYLDPEHGTNTIRTLVVAQIMAALLGFLTFLAFGGGYLSGGSATVATIVGMILLEAVHPPAVATAMAFALRAGEESNLCCSGWRWR